jgi:cytochrome c oxidase subunit I+III
VLSASCYALSSLMIFGASRWLARVPARSAWPFRLLVLAATPLFLMACSLDLLAQWQSGLRPEQSGYGAVVYLVASLQGFYAAILFIAAGYVLARSLTGKLDRVRRGTFDNVMLLWHFAVAQGLIGLALVTIFPRVTGG